MHRRIIAETEQISALPIPNLFLMTSGKMADGRTAPFFGGKASRRRSLARMRAQYDVILIDAPPVLHGPDARLLGRLADSAILITRARKTSHQDAMVQAASRLAADKISARRNDSERLESAIGQRGLRQLFACLRPKWKRRFNRKHNRNDVNVTRTDEWNACRWRGMIPSICFNLSTERLRSR